MQGVSVKDKVVLITGANRGIGESFALQALKMGARKVYATARDISTLGELASADKDRLSTLTLDVTSQEQVDAAAANAGDVQILINNAGVGSGGPITANADETGKRLEMDVNYFGIMKMAVAFAPILKNNGGGAIVNILSISGLCSFPFAPGYSASKAAGRSLTQALRAELAKQGTLVAGVFPGPIDTDMAKNLPMEKSSPDLVAVNVFEALANAEEDIFPDPWAIEFKRQLDLDAKAVERANAAGY
jgi:NAD(P)-dependent dehydrogenase (short-subunit alcohol dehydrogenase family)